MEISKNYSLPVLISDKVTLPKNCKFFHEKGDIRLAEKYESYPMKKIIHERTTKYQDIMVFDSFTFGRILCIDDIVQLTELDEFSYHEMLAFTPLSCHPKPKKVLIVGGGDGGLVKEVLKFPSVESVTICEIDQEIVDVCELYFPKVSRELRNAKVKLVIQDAFDFLADKSLDHGYDVIICDICDIAEDGPQESLGGEKFITSLYEALLPEGVICAQVGTSMWQRQPAAEYITSLCKDLFPVTKFMFINVPAFTFCQNGCIMSSKNKEVDFTNPYWKFTPDDLSRMNINFYNTAMHSAAFALPTFTQRYFDELGNSKGVNNNETCQSMNNKEALKGMNNNEVCKKIPNGPLTNGECNGFH